LHEELKTEARVSRRRPTAPQKPHCNMSCVVKPGERLASHHLETCQPTGQESPVRLDEQGAPSQFSSGVGSKDKALARQLPAVTDTSSGTADEMEPRASMDESSTSEQAFAPAGRRTHPGNSLIISGKARSGKQRSARKAVCQEGEENHLSSTAHNRNRRQSRLKAHDLDMAMAAAVAGV
jgi:hypothetical protein